MMTPLRDFDFIVNASYQSKMWLVHDAGSRGSPNYDYYYQNNDIFLIDLKLNYRIIDGLQFSVGAYNLLDRNYYYSDSNYMPGRRYFANIEYKF